jgi:4-carboxymuconolactone decarboxylase|tara:strand:- start:113 stop:490 length:378 start_codon:yes stop_codon:yes gene_type:complete
MNERRETGRQFLRENLGEDYLAKRDASTNSFNAPLRALSEEYAFGEIWSRPGLEPKTRSMLCLAMLTALNRPHEIRIHVNSALNNGCTVEEIQEVLLQSVLYCGIPASIDSFAVAEEVLRERGLL